MFANSRPVESIQSAAHPRLCDVVSRYLAVRYRREPSAAGREAFATVGDRLMRMPFVLDAGCGTGASTLALAREFPDRLVLGVDKSAARSGVGQRMIEAGDAPPNALLLRCELVDFWQLAAAAGLRCTRQYLLYPNPWPKPHHLKRRWHAHPVLSSMLALGGRIELRTNWSIYAEEFAVALRVAGMDVRRETFEPRDPITPFERKYTASGHTLWRCSADVPEHGQVTRGKYVARRCHGTI
jgi:tRNA G46 methylase TrmB